MGRRFHPARVSTPGEILLLALWACVIAGPYLDLRPEVRPAGREYASGIQTHHLWTRLRECGTCAFWNGSARGGSPALADVHGSMLHPVVAALTLAAGVPAGAKLALVASFFLAGLSGWWLASTLGAGVLGRLFSGAMAVAGGNLAAAAEPGALVVILSEASAGLVLAALVAFAREPDRRHASALGFLGGLFLVAGEGYLQAGFVLAAPTAILLVPADKEARRSFVAGGLRAVAIALLVAAPFVVPFAHFLPQFAKGVDPAFQTAQAFRDVPGNLVRSDPNAYYTAADGRFPFPSLYANYVGWIPLILAAAGLWRVKDRQLRRFVLFLTGQILLLFWIASAEPLRWAVARAPAGTIASALASLRFVSILAGLAILPLLGLAALGVDMAAGLLRRMVPGSGQLSAVFRSATILVVLGFALWSARAFGRRWIANVPVPGEVAGVVNALRTESLAWVMPPFGEQYFVEEAVGRGLKLSFGCQTWKWAARPDPEPERESVRYPPPPGARVVANVEGIHILSWEGRAYATLARADGLVVPCAARGAGGHLDVSCADPAGGVLVLRENSWTGWIARVDGRPQELLPGRWLSISLPPGSTKASFRYRPWDVWVGLLLGACGWLVTIRGLRSSRVSAPEA